MSDEQKPVAQPNAEAEKDVQNVLAELKGESTEAATPAAAVEETKQTDEAAEEARIVEAAAKLGEKSAQAEEQKQETKKQEQQQQQQGRGGRTNYRNNVKFDPSSQEVTSDPVQIRKQVEFYFSDSNLPMDKFLLSKVGGSSNRPVSLELLHSFKRMRRFQPFSAIVEAIKTSETVELTDNNTCVRRKTPLPETVTENHNPTVVRVFEDKAMSRSVYAKGFGEEGPTTQLEIEEFFAPYGPVNAIRLRRSYDKTFKGSVFVEFESEEKQQAFLALDPKPKWKEQDLLIKSKKDYCEEKAREIEAGRIKPSGGRGRGGHHRGGRGRGGNRGGRGDNKRGDWRDRRAADQKNGFSDKKEEPKEERKEIQKDARGVPVVQSTTDESAGQKRAREEDGANGDHPSKKVDAKQE